MLGDKTPRGARGEHAIDMGATVIHISRCARDVPSLQIAAPSTSRHHSGLSLAARLRPTWSSGSRRLQGTFSEPIPLNATDTYPAGYPKSRHIADERHTGTQMNGLMVLCPLRFLSARMPLWLRCLYRILDPRLQAFVSVTKLNPNIPDPPSCHVTFHRGQHCLGRCMLAKKTRGR